MVSLDKAVLARYSHGGKNFEIYVDSEKALALRDGADVSIHEVLAVEEIYKDARKGDRVGEGALKEVFGTTDILEVAKQIIKKGEIQLTTEQRRKLIEEKRKRIVNKIAREAYNPQTKTPHPPQRIEAAIEEAHVSIDPFEPVDSQVTKVLKAIRALIPISMEQLRIEVKVPPAYTGKAYSTLKKYPIEKEEWLNDGTLRVIIKIPAGIETDFYDALGVITKGDAEFRRIQ